jgi:cell division inhibitor SepF
MVKTLRPQTYDDVFYIGHYFREGVAVLMDLTGLPTPDVRAFVDFAAGLVVGCGGAMERVAPQVFLLRPDEKTAGAGTGYRELTT